MSLQGDDDISRLDFEVSDIAPGPQEFVDSFSGVNEPNQVIPTSTFRGAAIRKGNLVVISQGIIGSKTRFLEAIEGLRVIITSPELQGIRVVDINRVPTRRSIGYVTVSNLRRYGDGLRLLDSKRHDTRSGNQMTLEVERNGLVKSHRVDQSGAELNPDVERVRPLMDERQRQEFGLVAEVLKAIGSVKTT